MRKGIGLVCLLFISSLIAAGGARAATLSALAAVSLPEPAGGDESEFIRAASPDSAIANASLIADYSPSLPTFMTGTATATASSTDLKAGVSLQILDFDTSIRGEGIFLDSAAFMNDTYTITSADELYASPIFSLTGSLQSTSSAVLAQVQLFSSQLGGSQFYQAATSSLEVINEPVIPVARPISSAMPLSLSVSLSAWIEIRDLGLLADGGDYAAIADFSGTVSLLGFALFEDAAMTIPILEGFTIAGSSGNPIDVIPVPGANPVPLPPAAWLFASALAVLAGLRRRGKPRYPPAPGGADLPG